MREQFARALPKHLSPERFCRIAITALTRTPKLQECTQESLMKCLLDLSAFGLEPDGRRAHLIPYKNTCTLVIDWKGLAELAMRSGIVAKLHADVVCENDEFEFNLGEVVKHKIDFRKPRGEPYAAYAMATTKDGAKFVQVMAKDEIEKIRDNSQGYRSAIQYGKTDSPWMVAPGEMWKKTTFRRLSKWLPLSPEFRDAQERDDEEDTPPMRDVTPSASASTSRLFQSPPPVENGALPQPELSQVVVLQNEAPSLFPESDITPLDAVKAWLKSSGVKWSNIDDTLYAQGVTNELCNNPDDCTDDELRDVLAMRSQLEAVKGGRAK
jgi:recombination protein RecT